MTPPRNTTLDAEAAAFAAAAPQLAAWAEQWLVNRTDVWGGYNEIADRDKIMPSGQPLGSTTTRPRKKERGKIVLTRPHLVHHFEGRRISNIVGLHTTSPENTSKWAAPEIDWHGPDSTAPEINLRAALGWYAKLRGFGATPLLTDSNGAGGFHLLTIFDRPLPTEDVFWFCRWQVKDHLQFGLPTRPEHFPKQSKIYPTTDGQSQTRTRYGNWLRLPGRHHTRDHWSKVWNGANWLAGAEAVAYILTVRGCDTTPFPWAEIRRVGIDERVAAYMAKLPHLAEGQGRDDVAYGFAAWLVRDMKLPDADALDYLEQWDGGNTPPKGSERLAVIIANAHQYGQRSYGSGHNNGCGGGHASANGEPTGDKSAAPGFHLTDLGNAQRVVARHGKDLRHCHPFHKSFIFDGTRWAEDETGAAIRMVKETQSALYREVAHRVAELGDVGDDDERKQELAKLNKTLSHCLKWEDARRINACLQLATTEKIIPVLPSELDRDAWLFNVLNGTIDLKTGQLRQHRREDLMTKLAPVVFDPNALCPLWMKSLRRWMAGNERLITYLQRAIGYSLTGDVSEQVLFFLYGVGQNGKSTFLGTIKDMMGGYAWQSVSELLMSKNTEAHPTERADLFGRRFVSTIETDEGKRMAEALMKQLTGGDDVTARKMRQDFFSFKPTWKIFLAANHQPAIRGTDFAVWRRIKLVPFTVTIPAHEKDKTLPAKLKTEWPGILAWAVRGCLDWQRDGPAEPDEVRDATNKYRAEQDLVQGFIDQCCLLHALAKVRTSLLYEMYQKWSGDKIMTTTAFRNRLSDKGFESKRSSGGNYYYHGIGVPNDEPSEGR